MFPEAFRKRLLNQAYIDSDSLLKALSEPSPVSIRINRAKLRVSPFDSQKVDWCRDGFYLPSRPGYTLDPLFHSGSYYPQEASSMFLEEVFRQTAPENGKIKVLDLCGAPGGKSTHLSSLIGTGSLLVANDVIRSRASVLAENLSKWGLSNVIVTQNDPSAFSRLKSFFDIILVDAPCSGEGMFRDAIAVNEWSPENASLCSERQKRILMDVWPALKENGILIYSTCSFNPAENEENIKWLLSRKRAESVRIDISEYKAVTEIVYQGIFGYGFYPGRRVGEGLFISVLRKAEKVETKNERTRKVRPLKVSGDEAERALLWSDSDRETLLKSGDNIITFPGAMSDYEILSGTLRIIKTGTLLLTARQNKYLPAHELAMSVLLKKDMFPSLSLDLPEALAYLHRDAIRSLNTERGWTLVSYKGVNLGFVNNIGKRTNNYYPVEWRIRMDLPQKINDNILLWDSSNDG